MLKLEDERFEFPLVETLIDYISKMGEPGGILVFLPGWNWIFALMKSLQNHPVFGGPSFRILPLHSSLPREEQRKVRICFKNKFSIFKNILILIFIYHSRSS